MNIFSNNLFLKIPAHVEIHCEETSNSDFTFGCATANEGDTNAFRLLYKDDVSKILRKN